MTAHIDEDIETEECECNPRDLHAMQRLIKEVKFSRAGWIATSFISFAFNIIFIIARVIQ